MGTPLTVLHVNFIPFVWYFSVCSFWSFFCWFVYFLLPHLTEISWFIFWWPSAWECWAKGMSAGCPPGVQTCHEASGDYSPAYMVSCTSVGFWVPVTSGVRGIEKFTKIWWLLLCSHVVKKPGSSLFCVVFLSYLPVLNHLLVWWMTVFLFLKTQI